MKPAIQAHHSLIWGTRSKLITITDPMRRIPKTAKHASVITDLGTRKWSNKLTHHRIHFSASDYLPSLSRRPIARTAATTSGTAFGPRGQDPQGNPTWIPFPPPSPGPGACLETGDWTLAPSGTDTLSPIATRQPHLGGETSTDPRERPVVTASSQMSAIIAIIATNKQADL